MCGIYGTTLRYAPGMIRRKLSLMGFRGPDHTGTAEYALDGGGLLTLGHVRLSIIDLDRRSNQPFRYSPDISVVFNGEIYNYRELAAHALCGVTLRTASDTEVVCAMYERYGEECVRQFNGMFALVIYDRRRQVLFGARDRIGKKPLYYCRTPEGFEFASQPKVIACGRDLSLDALSRRLYLLHGAMPDPFTPYSEMRKLRAGETFRYDLGTGALTRSTYWDVHSNSCGFLAPRSYAEAKETVRGLLDDAVRLRLNANVPVGTFLSGGIDSSLVCALVARHDSSLCAYTARFDNAAYDESAYAADVARAIGIPVKMCECSGAGLRRVFHDYTLYFDEPFADDSLLPSSLVAEEARRDVTVILGGDGGDELFYGYPKYEWVRARLAQYRRPWWLRLLASPYFAWRDGWRELRQSVQRDYADAYRADGLFCHDMRGAERFSRTATGRLCPDREYLLDKGRGVLAYADYDIKTFLNAVNQKTDRATMRSSIELRSPILDYRVAEYSRLLPYEYLCGGGLGLKRILKDILYDMVPRRLLEREKRGFVAPVEDWFRGDMREEFAATVSRRNVETLLPELNAARVERLRDRFLAGEPVSSRVFFTIYTYVKWHETYCGTSASGYTAPAPVAGVGA